MSTNVAAIFDREIITARRIVKTLRGGSRSLLVSDHDARLWIVKFLHNPQHSRLVINESITTYVGQKLGLTLPDQGIIHFPKELVDEIREQVGSSKLGKTYTEGLHYGSRYAGRGLMPGHVVDAIFPDKLRLVTNLSEAIGVLVMDTWLDQRDYRQVVYARHHRSAKLKAYWIDHGECLGGQMWKLTRSGYGPYYAFPAYRDVSSWEEFEPWLQKIEAFPVEELEAVFYSLPSEWRCGQEADFESVLAQLEARKGRVKTMLLDVFYRDRNKFPAWPEHLRSGSCLPPLNNQVNLLEA